MRRVVVVTKQTQLRSWLGEAIKTFRRQVPGMVLLVPGFLWLVLFTMVPLVLVSLLSLAPWGTYGHIQSLSFNFENYRDLLQPIYLKILADTTALALTTTLVCLAAGYPIAWYIARAPLQRRGLLLLLVVLPFWTSMLIRTYAWMVILRAEGLLNTLLQWLGLTSAPLELLYTPGAVLVGMVYVFLPFMILPLYSSLEKLDGRLLEAAADLGASPWTTFWRVTWPLSRPGVVGGSILVFIPSLGMFVISDLLGGAKAVLIGNLIQKQFTAARNWPFGAAASVMLILTTLLLLRFYTRSAGFSNQEG